MFDLHLVDCSGNASSRDDFGDLATSHVIGIDPTGYLTILLTDGWDVCEASSALYWPQNLMPWSPEGGSSWTIQGEGVWTNHVESSTGTNDFAGWSAPGGWGAWLPNEGIIFDIFWYLGDENSNYEDTDESVLDGLHELDQ